MLGFKLRRKKKMAKVIDEKRLSEIVHEELNAYIKREELQGYIEKIERDKRKKQQWDSLSPRKKIRLLRYVLEKKGMQHEQK